jgi:hypothetical protein
VRKQGSDIVEGSTPSKTEVKPTSTTSNVSIRGAGNVEALATWDNFAPPFGKKKLWMMVKTWTDWNPIRKLLRISGLKEGAVVAVGEQPPEKKEQLAGR